MGELCDGQPLFPGDTEIDQLFLIQKVLGELTPEQNEMFLKNPRFIGLKFPDIQKIETLEKKYVGKMSKKALSFMNACLAMDPKDRLVGLKALTHPYFDDIRFKDSEFYKITEGEDLTEVENREATRPIQSSQGVTDKISRPSFDGKHRMANSRAGITAYSGFELSKTEFPFKRKTKKTKKTKKLDAIYGKKSLYDLKNVSVAQFTEKASSFGKHKYSNGALRNKDFINIYGNNEMSNTQYTSRNDESNMSNSFINPKKPGQLYKGIQNSKSTAAGAFPTQKLNESHEYNYDISTPLGNSIMKSSPFKPDLLTNNMNSPDSKEKFQNNIIVEDEKEVNYSSSNYSSKKTGRSPDNEGNPDKINPEPVHQTSNVGKDASFSKDLIMQMKEKIKLKQRNGGDSSKILVLGASNVEENYKDTEYMDLGGNPRHHVSSFNNTKHSKKVSSLGRSPHKKKHKIVKKIPFKQGIPKHSLYNRSMYGHDSSNTLSRLTRDSFHKKTNKKEIVLADSGSYISTAINPLNTKNMNLEQKMHLMQRESASRGSLGKPPGTSGGRIPTKFGLDDLPPRRYLPKLKGLKPESERSEYVSSHRKDDETVQKTLKRTQPNQGFSRGSRRDKRKQFAIFPEGFDPHEELDG